MSKHKCSENFYVSVKELAAIGWAVMVLFYMYDVAKDAEWHKVINFVAFFAFNVPSIILIVISRMKNPPECIQLRKKGKKLTKIYIELSWKLATAGLYATTAFFIFKLSQNPKFTLVDHQSFLISGFLHLAVSFILLILMYARAKAESESHALANEST